MAFVSRRDGIPRVRTRPWKLGVLLGAALILGAGPSLAKPGYLNYPDLHGDQIVFTAEGDLWLAATDGSQVRRLTAHAGNEAWPRFSPDGKWIAFRGEYDGNSDVFVVSTEGGEPRRLTWHPAAESPVCWSPDGERILFRTYRYAPNGAPQIYSVPRTGGDPEEVAIGRANYLDIDPVSGRYAFTRTWGGGTWKRYRGGTAPEIWVGHPEQGDFREVTDFDGLDIYPMWHDGRIYFLSDKGGTGNLWSIKPNGSDRRRHTDQGEWDADNAAMGPSGRIVFVVAGDVHLFDPSTGEDRGLAIDLPSERTLTRKRYPNPQRYVTGAALSPDGERVAVMARGEIFSVPVEDGVTLPITRGSGAREDRVAFHPKGKRIAYVTDESGNEAIVSADAWGRGEVESIKAPGPGLHSGTSWSPDGKWIAYGDQSQRLYIIPAEGGEPIEVDYCSASRIREFAWSPDGRWLAYSKNNNIYFASIYIYDTQEQVTRQITGEMTDDYSPSWDPDGRFLYFLSDRSLDPLIGRIDFATIITESTKPYMLLLREDVENPFADTAGIPPDDEEEDEDDEGDDESADESAAADSVGTAGADSTGAEGLAAADSTAAGEEEEDDAKEDEELEPVEIEFDGLAERILEVPVPAGRYAGTGATSGKLFYLAYDVSGIAGRSPMGTGAEPGSRLMAFDLDDEEAQTFVSGARGFEIQAEAGKMLISKGGSQLFVVGTGSPPGDLSEGALDLDALVIELDPREEWRQIFLEGWRVQRDLYWDPEMRGLDWEAIRDKYASLLPRLGTRADLRDLMAEMIGELSTSHTYIWGGDPGQRVPSHSTGLLGAELAREGDYFKVTRIYRGGDPDGVRSPLREPGVDVTEGDYILSVNLRPFAPDLPFEASLENLAGTEVLLAVSSVPDPDSARQVIVTPLPGEGPLVYADWVRRNREYVAEKSDGKIGYIHLPDMGGAGLVEFDKWFYPQLIKEGMVVDVRWNGGGNVSQLILERFQRSILSWDLQRYGAESTYPHRVLNGPFVVLVNEHAGSDGDIFPAAVQLAGLAPVIGTRSWGGVVGIYGPRPFVDGGASTQPVAAWWDEQRGWGLEGSGVIPDIELENLPQDLGRGVDAQLDRSIEEVLRLHRRTPPRSPQPGPISKRTRATFRNE